MELGQCPRCAQAYTTSEVVGFGILRARAASAGGPRVEYACPGCGAVVHLIPYGEGRYAPPGKPPPVAVPEADRRPPWLTDEAPEGPRPARTASAEPAQQETPGWAAGSKEAREGDPIPPEGPRPRREQAPTSSSGGGEDTPMGPAEALELLGVKPSAEAVEIDHAFRELSLTCHPDKAAHLDEDFQALAERKFKRLLKAYEILSS